MWLAETNFIKLFSPAARDLDLSLASIARDPLERLHLSFLKWNLGVGKRTSNAPVWGDCVRMPINYLDINITIDDRGNINTNLYNKLNDFNFPVVMYNFPQGNMSLSVGYNVLYGQVLRYSINTISDLELQNSCTVFLL